MNLRPGQSEQPTGPVLVHLLERDGIQILRLVAETPDPQPALYRAMHDGGWQQIFGELDAAHIGAILLIGGEAGVDGVKSPGSWPPEPPFPTFPRAGQVIESTGQWIANQGAILADIQRQCHGIPMLPATFDEHEDDTIHEHEFVNTVSPSWPSAVA